MENSAILSWVLENPDRVIELLALLFAIFRVDQHVRETASQPKVKALVEQVYSWVEWGYRTGVISKGRKEFEASKRFEEKFFEKFGRLPSKSEKVEAEASWTVLHEKDSKGKVPPTGE